MTPEQSAAVERLTDDLPKVGEPECQFSTVNAADIRTLLAALDEAQQDAKSLRLVNTTFALHLDRTEHELRERNDDAARYLWLRERDLDSISAGGLFVGRTPDNVVINGDDLDAAIDAARAGDAA